MKENLRKTVIQVFAFLTLCTVGIFAIVAVFGQLRFTPETTYNAVFTNVSGLKEGDFVRIAGVEAGSVKKITVRADTTVEVEFGLDNSVVLTDGNNAAIRYQNLTGDRYLAITEGPGGVRHLNAGATIPLERTQPAMDINALLGGFKPLFKALNPDQVNALTGQLIAAFQGQGDVVNSFLTQTAALTNTLADRDQLVGQVIDNLNTVLGTLSDQSGQLDKTVDSVSQLVAGLAEQKENVANGLAHTNAAAASVADLLVQARLPLKETVTQLDRTAGLVAADSNYVDNLLNTLPDKYRLLARQGLYGDFFSFYMCDIVLKLNGKGGQPVFVKMAGQSTGRCTPK
ncbi:MCE family protein [Mycolicibacterium fluoranthenivorans]|uniref:MCE family protein n=1 Tax=Mycolicibacterium fluoranthenivorans TaxID=258505 RepID=A0A7G8PGD1_9MYCO|nr:MCE family protein [Mycolicibacterium fluoranthenivorans]QNJ93397.1 MCE family protein [Mycolicibacterium fluoranthenivorans]